MVQKDFDALGIYNKGFSVSNLFSINSVGIVTANDVILINSNKEDLQNNISNFFKKEIDIKLIQKINYRPFDQRYIYYDVSLVERDREKTMRHFLQGKNMGLCLCRQFKVRNEYAHSFISKSIIESCYVSNKTSEISSIFPLYLYPDPNNPDVFKCEERVPNLDMEIVEQIEKKLKLAFIPEENIVVDLAKGYKGTFAPIHLLDYIYAVLHSPKYRDTYKEFLKTDFPLVPYPKDVDKFWQLVELGKQIRELHLMDKKGTANVTYPNEGSNILTRGIVQKDFELTDKDKQTGRVWINEEQYFDHVPVTAWEFYIGGYQPAQKWLKDRKDRELSFDDIKHYQNIIYALMETDRLMKEVDKIGVI